MRFERLSASPDIVGGRIWLTWDFALAALETPAAVPDVLLRRKQRDFDFPLLAPNDPYLVYDGATFPPAPIPGVLKVIDLPTEETVEDGLRVVTQVISVAAVSAGEPVEIQRRLRSVCYDRDGAPVRLRVRLLDAGGLEPLHAYYYELDDGTVPGPEDMARYRSVVTAGGTYGLNRRLYAMLPETYRARDDRPLPEAAAFAGVPEATPVGGQLRRFVDVFGMGLDALRSSAETLRNVRDPQQVEARFLGRLSEMVGWEPSATAEIQRQRNELQTATRLFDVAGTVPALQTLVAHHAGWRTQVTEFAQNIARANEPARRSLYIRAEQPGGDWRGADDAAAIFAFPAAGTTGGPGLPATMTSGTVEPFALRPGMDLTLAVDGGAPVRVRFGPDDFADIAKATAVEVAAVIDAAFDTLKATAAAGAVTLRTVLASPAASLKVQVASSSLLALNDAPDGPITAFADAAGQLRVLYEERRDPTREEATFLPATAAPPLRPIDRSRRELRLKSWAYGLWRGEQPLPAWVGDACSPGAALLIDKRVLAGWIDLERPPAGRLRIAFGSGRAARPASITGRRAGPFPLVAGTKIAFRGAFGTQVFTVKAADYPTPGAAKASEIATAIAAQCPALQAAPVGPPGAEAVRVSTKVAGDGPWLRIDLSASTAARTIGLGDPRLAGHGDWDPAVDWAGPLAGPVAAGPVADASLVADPPGGARMFWSEHQQGAWQIRQAHLGDRLTLVTAQGASQRTGPGGWTSWKVADGLPNNDVRSVAVDARAALWFATAGGLGERRANGVWAAYTTTDGLASNDVRDVALLPDSALWAATPAGLSIRGATGVFTVVAAAPGGLIHADVRAVAAEPGGAAWAATPAGVSRRGLDGLWRSWTAADGLPAGAPRRIAAGPDGRVALATAAGVGTFDGTAWRSHGLADGLPSADIRGVAWGDGGVLYAATAAGLGIWDGRRWQLRVPANGLPASDLRSVAALPDGRIALGTATGLLVGLPFAPAAEWAAATVADGIAGPIVVGIHAGWSAPVILAGGAGGNREPRAATDALGRTWLFWSRRQGAAATVRPSWTIRLRRYDPGPGSWGAELPITTAPPAGAEDRQPAPEPAAGGGFRVFISSDRTGGRSLLAVPVDNAGAAGAPGMVAGSAAELSRPAAVAGPGGRTWLLCRSDAPVAAAQVAAIPPPGEAGRTSMRVPEAAALTVRTGSRPPVLGHVMRALARRRWGDYFVYTPERPDLIDAEVPSQSHVYTRRTIGLYLRPSPIGTPVTAEAIGRLRQMLGRFLPINLRLVLIATPDPLVELIYPPGSEVGETWADFMPFKKIIDDLTAAGVAVPDLGMLIANDPLDAPGPAMLWSRGGFPDP